MERKIGEIFEYNGEWHQCVESTHGIVGACEGCSFYTIERLCSQSANDSILGHCDYIHRIDDKNVIFKKLEKVGEQFLYKGKQMQSYRRATDALICNWNNRLLLLEHGDSDIIDIEIKQNKEDMGEYEMHDAKEDIPEFDKVVDECLFGKQELKLKPFDLQKAKEGKPVCTRDGHKTRIICFDAKCNLPIIALITQSGGDECLAGYKSNGRFINLNESDYDLMMAQEEKEGWVNLYKSSAYSTKEEAMKYRNKCNDYIDTIKISWEE